MLLNILILKSKQIINLKNMIGYFNNNGNENNLNQNENTFIL